MKLPADSFIDPRKISHYLLRPLEESDKSEFLADAGYELPDSQRLLDDIRTQLLPLDAEHIGPFEYGEKFRIRGFLQGPNGLRCRRRFKSELRRFKSGKLHFARNNH